MHGATLCVVGFTMDKVEVRLSNLMAFDARAIGNWGCTPEHYPAALELVLAGKVKVKPFVEIHPLADINHVFEATHQREIKRRASCSFRRTEPSRHPFTLKTTPYGDANRTAHEPICPRRATSRTTNLD